MFMREPVYNLVVADGVPRLKQVQKRMKKTNYLKHNILRMVVNNFVRSRNILSSMANDDDDLFVGSKKQEESLRVR